MVNDEILESIKKSLPAHLSDTLKEELEELQRFRNKEPEVKQTYENYKKLESNQYKFYGVETKERELALERQKFEIEKRDTQITLLKEKYQDVIKLMDSVFRNQRLVHRTSSQDSFPVPMNGYTSTVQGSSYGTKEIVEE